MSRIASHDIALALPPIAMRQSDAARLRLLAEAAMKLFPTTADFLAGEIERADILPDEQPMTNIVAMDSRVTFRDEATGQTRTATLVYPDRADVSAGRISVLTPIGAALIGLSPGQTIEFRSPTGGLRALTVLSVA
jgi:regulator of nucleoside diphosphate kinase